MTLLQLVTEEEKLANKAEADGFSETSCGDLDKSVIVYPAYVLFGYHRSQISKTIAL